jgi:hypothetical protein
MILRHPLDLLYGVLVFYLAGVAWWLFCSFLRADYFTWPGVFKGFIWPWLWLKSRRKP